MTSAKAERRASFCRDLLTTSALPKQRICEAKSSARIERSIVFSRHTDEMLRNETEQELAEFSARTRAEQQKNNNAQPRTSVRAAARKGNPWRWSQQQAAITCASSTMPATQTPAEAVSNGKQTIAHHTNDCYHKVDCSQQQWIAFAHNRLHYRPNGMRRAHKQKKNRTTPNKSGAAQQSRVEHSTVSRHTNEVLRQSNRIPNRGLDSQSMQVQANRESSSAQTRTLVARKLSGRVARH